MLETVVKWMLVSAAVFLLCIYHFELSTDCELWLKQRTELKKIFEANNTPSVTKRPLLLLWTAFHGRTNDIGFLTKKMEFCKAKCEISNDRKRINETNLIIFHGCDMNKTDLPVTKSWQIKLFLMRESPGRQNHFYRDWDKIPMNYFNSTSTYRDDADYHFPYITLQSLKENPNLQGITEEELDIAIKKKKNGSFSMISHCGTTSSREKIIRRLGDFTPVERYGKCGTPCDKDCENKLIDSHFFYLGMENSICEQYVTEKLGRFKRLIVPVSIKRSVVPKWIPADSFIAVDDFCSLEELAKYMNYLMKNTKAYKSYFSWTRQYSPVDGELGICKICEDAYTNSWKKKDYSKYPSISDYFSPKTCSNSDGTRMIKNRCDLKANL